jgi:hypothetical protein
MKAQGRYWHETRPEKQHAEQSVEEARNLEDVAEPGEANLVGRPHETQVE